jgi:rSAM/selenodomain-associated transferase 1
LDRKLIIFVKAPRPGEVKTRLAKALGHERACDAYRKLVDRLLSNLKSLSDVELCFAPADAEKEIAPWLRSGWQAVPQTDGDLGARLTAAFARAFGAGAQRVVIVGSDCPFVTVKDIKEAFENLTSRDMAVGPATDGGYWLIGLRQPQPGLFQKIPWSTDQVLAETLSRARTLGLKMHLLRLLSDVDTQEDWEAFH